VWILQYLADLGNTAPENPKGQMRGALYFALKGQSNEKVCEIMIWNVSFVLN
jgi:hypothetical protein